MATLTEILERVRQNVVDVPSDTESRLLGWVQEAQSKAEDAYNWLSQRTSAGYATTLGSPVLATKPSNWIVPISNPWYRTGVGKAVAMEWEPTTEQLNKEFSAGLLERDRGSPKVLIESPTQLLVYPPPDARNTLGAFSVAGEYQIVLVYRARATTLTLAAQSNRFTTDPNLALYLEHYATAQASMFNHDPNGATHLVIAQAHLRDAKRLQKQRSANKLRLWPRRDVYGARRQRRS